MTTKQQINTLQTFLGLPEDKSQLWTQLQKLKEKTISEDDSFRSQEDIQKITDKYIKEVDSILKKVFVEYGTQIKKTDSPLLSLAQISALLDKRQQAFIERLIANFSTQGSAGEGITLQVETNYQDAGYQLYLMLKSLRANHYCLSEVRKLSESGQLKRRKM